MATVDIHLDITDTELAHIVAGGNLCGYGPGENRIMGAVFWLGAMVLGATPPGKARLWLQDEPGAELKAFFHPSESPPPPESIRRPPAPG